MIGREEWRETELVFDRGKREKGGVVREKSTDMKGRELIETKVEYTKVGEKGKTGREVE